MRSTALLRLVGRDLRRTRGALATAGFGILAGTAALVFFLSLGLGVRSVLLGHVFPLDKLEFEPQQGTDPGLLSLLIGGTQAPRIAQSMVDALAAMPEVARVYPKLRFAFPCSARGGAALFGHDVGTSEMIADGVDPALVTGDVRAPWVFADPLLHRGRECTADADCEEPRYCELAPDQLRGHCVDPVPALVSRYLVELFNRGIAPAHGLPPVGESLLERASGITFNMRLGESLLGQAKFGRARTVRARVVGISPRAIDLGLTLPLDTVRRWNHEFAGENAARSFTSVLVETRNTDAASRAIAAAATMGLVPRDTRARDVSVLVNGVMALLSLVASVILFMAGSNIAYTFRALLVERRAEIGLYRAVGASKPDIITWQLTLAAFVGTVYAAVGVGVGWLATRVADALASEKLPEFPFKPDSFFAFPPWLLAGSVAFGALFALLGALPSALRAASADPRETLAQPA
ncbi:MAG: ABC transporter permease [Polyangiaceae bacterium]|nr:ABC transporter permease [Polyangiaceae bacterium]